MKPFSTANRLTRYIISRRKPIHEKVLRSVRCPAGADGRCRLPEERSPQACGGPGGSCPGQEVTPVIRCCEEADPSGSAFLFLGFIFSARFAFFPSALTGSRCNA